MTKREKAAAITRSYEKIDAANRIIAHIRQRQEMGDNPSYFPLVGLATVHPKSSFDHAAGHKSNLVFRDFLSIPITEETLIKICEDRIVELETLVAEISIDATIRPPA